MEFRVYHKDFNRETKEENFQTSLSYTQIVGQDLKAVILRISKKLLFCEFCSFLC